MGHSKVTVREMYRGYRIGFKLPIHVYMMTAAMKLTNPDRSVECCCFQVLIIKVMQIYFIAAGVVRDILLSNSMLNG